MARPVVVASVRVFLTAEMRGAYAGNRLSTGPPPKILDDRNFSCDRGLGGEDGLVEWIRQAQAKK